jgi:hypothetical protein
VQVSAEVQATPASWLSVAPAALAGSSMAQAVPSHRSASLTVAHRFAHRDRWAGDTGEDGRGGVGRIGGGLDRPGGAVPPFGQADPLSGAGLAEAHRLI